MSVRTLKLTLWIAHLTLWMPETQLKHFQQICDENWSLEDEKSSSKIPNLVQYFAYIRQIYTSRNCKVGTHSTAHMNLQLPRNSKITVQNPICGTIIHVNRVVWSLSRSPEAGWSISCIFFNNRTKWSNKIATLTKGFFKIPVSTEVCPFLHSPSQQK